jgi:serine/threonine protein phosphatase PrpC
MKFTHCLESRIGGRPCNEDRLACRHTSEALVMVVADGMGGHDHGELAAQAAVDCVVDTFLRVATPRLPEPYLFLSQVLLDAHQAVNDVARVRGLEHKPMTTCVVCVIQDGIACWAHAGDSRLYGLRDGRVLSRTRDHSRVQLLLEEGLISADEARRHPQRNRIFSCLGGAMPPQVEFSRKLALRDGDILLLCSDGAWGPLAEGELVRLLSTGDLIESLPRMIDVAEQAAGPRADNLTALALRWIDPSGAHDDGEFPADAEIEKAIAALRRITPFLPKQ